MTAEVTDSFAAPAPEDMHFHVTRRQLWIVFAITFVVLLTWHREQLWSPPEAHSATRQWLEAAFLADTNFDYQRLRYEEQTHLRGGAFVYMTSIVPTLLAGLMVTLPGPPDVFLVSHLMIIASASIVVSVLVALTRPHLGWTGSALLAAVFVSTPLVSAQISLLNLELPTLAAGSIAILCLRQQQYGRCAFFTNVAVLIKATWIFTYLAILSYLAWMAVGYSIDKSPRRRNAWIAVAVHLLGFVLQVLLHNAGGMDHESSRPTRI